MTDMMWRTLLLFLLPMAALGANDTTLVIVPSGNIVREASSNLTLTCQIEPQSPTVKEYKLAWSLPIISKINSPRVVVEQSRNRMRVTILSLEAGDSGWYVCEASDHGFSYRRSVYVIVSMAQPDPDKCLQSSSAFFDCGKGMICIAKRYPCDARRDCSHSSEKSPDKPDAKDSKCCLECKCYPDGSDEARNYCGKNACDGKILCEDGRCLDRKLLSMYCKNDNNFNLIPCCDQYLTAEAGPENGRFPSTFYPWREDFLHSTVYTVASCAVAVFFFVAILVVAVYRVHMRRSLLMALRNTQGTGSFHRRSDPLTTEACWLDSAGGDVCDSGDLSIYPAEASLNLNSDLNEMWAAISQMPKPPPYSEALKHPLPFNEPPPPYSEAEPESSSLLSPSTSQPPISGSTLVHVVNCPTFATTSGEPKEEPCFGDSKSEARDIPPGSSANRHLPPA